MKKYVLLGAIVLAVGIIINYSLGGFTSLEPKIVTVDNYTIYGTSFEGNYKSNKLTKLVENMRTNQQKIKSHSDLIIVNYINEAKETTGLLTNFIGISTSDTVNYKLLGTLEKRVIAATKAVRISIKVQPLVMPSPEKIKKAAFNFAKKKNITLQNLSIEQYQENGFLIIEYPIKGTGTKN